ncbi:hypothetical protein [Kribbella italica]|uniref:Uncharacterized protein n=1 Tax=Kribbella italica TaxID=1540520 RepID=A0A7W9JDG8_9ACTN|nr:hypothetical protein [Kribbella italica]MBB5839979.1 hypothetical protein [Kribbella italica]
MTFVASHHTEVVGLAVATFTNYGHAPYGVLEELAVTELSRATESAQPSWPKP